MPLTSHLSNTLPLCRGLSVGSVKSSRFVAPKPAPVVSGGGLDTPFSMPPNRSKYSVYRPVTVLLVWGMMMPTRDGRAGDGVHDDVRAARLGRAPQIAHVGDVYGSIFATVTPAGTFQPPPLSSGIASSSASNKCDTSLRNGCGRVERPVLPPMVRGCPYPCPGRHNLRHKCPAFRRELRHPAITFGDRLDAADAHALLRAMVLDRRGSSIFLHIPTRVPIVIYSRLFIFASSRCFLSTLPFPFPFGSIIFLPHLDF